MVQALWGFYRIKPVIVMRERPMQTASADAVTDVTVASSAIK
jgi:hypothetical protein